MIERRTLWGRGLCYSPDYSLASVFWAIWRYFSYMSFIHLVFDISPLPYPKSIEGNIFCTFCHMSSLFIRHWIDLNWIQVTIKIRKPYPPLVIYLHIWCGRNIEGLPRCSHPVYRTLNYRLIDWYRPIYILGCSAVATRPLNYDVAHANRPKSTKSALAF